MAGFLLNTFEISFRMRKPPHPLFIQALQAFQGGDFDHAKHCFSMLLDIQPKNFDALHIMGVLLGMEGMHQTAIGYFRRAIKVDANHNLVHFNLAKALSDTGEDAVALKHHITATQLAPKHAEAWLNYGRSLSKLGKFEEAIKYYDKALQLNPNLMEALSNKGAAMNDLGRFDAALVMFDQAININPNHAETWSNKAIAHGALKQFDSAFACYDKAISLKEDYVVAWNNKGASFKELKRYKEAIDCYDHVIQLSPDYLEAWVNKADALDEIKCFDEALTCYEKAIQLDPDFYCLQGHYLHGKNKKCDWLNFDSHVAKCEHNVRSGIKSVSPFIGLSLFDDPVVQLMIARSFSTEARFSAKQNQRKISKKTAGEKIRVAYVSPEFHNHPVSYLIAEMIELHDRHAFEIYGLSLGPDVNDEMRLRLRKGFDHFIDISEKSPSEIIAMCDHLDIDIAVDLCGYTGLARLDLFAQRLAPIQVSYLGFIGSSGADFMDYIIADEIVIPKDERKNFTEKVIYLPQCYQVSDSKRKISDRVFTRGELGLPESGTVYCCFNASYKIRPQLFDLWMRILQRAEGSVLWLLDDNKFVIENLRKEAINRGLDPNRLVFAQRVSNEDYLARFQVADLFLDTFPYNAGTTANDALFAGLPVLTLQGQSFVSRMCSSLLCAVDLTEMVAHTEKAYEDKAVDLAMNPQMLREIKTKLAAAHKSAPLFDTASTTKHIETAYEMVVQRSQAGLMPDTVYLNNNSAGLGN